MKLKRSIYVLFWTFITVLNIFDLYAAVCTPAKVYLIASQTGRFKFEIASIKSNNHFFVLVTLGKGVCALKERNAKNFDKIITTDNFSVSGLRAICYDIVKSYNLKNIQQIQILTHDELKGSLILDFFPDLNPRFFENYKNLAYFFNQ